MCQGETKELETECEALRDACQKLEQQEQEINKNSLDVRHQLEKLETVVKEHEQKTAHYVKQVRTSRASV